MGYLTNVTWQNKTDDAMGAYICGACCKKGSSGIALTVEVNRFVALICHKLEVPIFICYEETTQIFITYHILGKIQNRHF